MFFYGLPLLGAFVYGLLKPGCTWMSDLTVFFAGAMIQVTPCTVNLWNWLWIHSVGYRCSILKWVAPTICGITLSHCYNYFYWLITVFINSLCSLQRGLTRVTAIKVFVVSSHPANDYLDHIYPLKHTFCNKQTSSAFSHTNLNHAPRGSTWLKPSFIVQEVTDSTIPIFCFLSLCISSAEAYLPF